MKVKISKEAAQELEEAAEWYEKKQESLGARFILSFEHAIALLQEPNPPLMLVYGEAAKLDAKKLILHKFPFSIITIDLEQTIVIVALHMEP